MPTATFDLVRDGKYLVIRICTKSRWEKRVNPRDKNSWSSVAVIDAPLPLELAAFSATAEQGPTANGFPEDHPYHAKGYSAVWLDLAKDASGVDAMPMLTAADWLRDQGWTVEAVGGWCKGALAGLVV